VKDQAKLFAIADVHEARKQKWARNIFFDPAGDETNKWASNQKYAPLDMFLIYFGEATFDQIEKDTKMTMETMVGVIGGTMGLFTGFSILSGVEIVYYAAKFLLSSVTKKSDKKRSSAVVTKSAW